MVDLKRKREITPVTDFVPTRNNLLQSTSQLTLAAGFERSGVGLHTGHVTTVRVLPAQAWEGRYFVRVDLPQQPAIAADINSVHQTTLSVELAHGPAKVRTVEHLLAALAGMGVRHARIEIDGPEVPLLDGSALPWVEEINRVGVAANKGVGCGVWGVGKEGVRGRGGEGAMRNNVETQSIASSLWVHHRDAFVAALPASELRFSYAIDFDLPAIGRQWYSWSPSRENFATEIAPARTFGLAHQIEQLRAAGLIKGGSLDNALVCGPEGWLNPPLRFANEPVRHKILDLVGDLSLLGSFPVAHFVAYKASHNLHVKLTRLLREA